MMQHNKQRRKRIPHFLAALLLSVGLAINLAPPPVSAAAPTINEYSLPGIAYPLFITAGPDGNLWFTETASGIGRITPSGVIIEYTTGITAGSTPASITAGPDGNLWFTETAGNRIGKITPAGVVTEYSAGITTGANPGAITAGPDGNLWFTEQAGNRIGKITTAGVVTEYSAGITAGAFPTAITAGPDGNLWFTENQRDRIGKITTSGVITEYSAGITAGAGLQSITALPDGNLWFTEQSGDRIGKITTSGVITEYSAGITAGAYSADITTGPDGNLWFTELLGNRIGKITPAGVVTEYSAGITAGSYPAGITTGPDGNLWFTEYSGNRIGRLNLIPTVTNPDGSTTTTVAAGDTFPALDLTVKANQTLILDGNICDVTVQSGGTLMGTGHACTITVQPGGTIAPGHSPGCITSGNLSLAGAYTAQLAGTTACSQYDQLQVTGTVTVGGALNVSLLNGFIPTTGNTFTLITNDASDPVTGTFAGLAEGSTVTIGTNRFTISYVGGTGNDVTLTALAPLPGVPNTGVERAANNNLPLLLITLTTITMGILLATAKRLQVRLPK